jgi:hypothetical protein
MFISIPDPDPKKVRTFSTKLLAFCRDFRLKMSGLRLRPGCSYALIDTLRLCTHLVVTNTTVQSVLRIRIRDPVPFRPMDPGSGIRNRFFPDPGSQTHIFDEGPYGSWRGAIWVTSS